MVRKFQAVMMGVVALLMFAVAILTSEGMPYALPMRAWEVPVLLGMFAGFMSVTYWFLGDDE